MANKLRGETDLTVGEKTYVLVWNVNAACELETLMSTPARIGVPEKLISFQEVFERAIKLKRHIEFRAMFWALLRKNHREVTLEQAGELMEEAGGVEGFAMKLADLFFASTPAKSDLEALGIKTDARPQKARAPRKAGTGKSSAPKPAMPA